MSDSTLAQAKQEVIRPAYDRSRVTVGIVHFGPGAFFRAHQADYMNRLLSADPSWGISAVSLRTPDVRDSLAPQDGLYTLAELGEETRYRVIGSVRELLAAPESPERVLARLDAPETRIVTATVTEKGYCLGPDGRLDLHHPDINHDLSSAGAPASLIGWVLAGLRVRRDAGLPPFAVISCDNLSDNGLLLKQAVVDLAKARGEHDFAAWIEGEARFPRTMVDSITPATDDALRDGVAHVLGLQDAWPVQREAFTQWVIEDLGLDGPDWASVGVTLAPEVTPYEQAKLRLLNGAHSTLAYAGLLAGFETVADTMADPALAGFVRRLMIDDIVPTLARPPEFDLEGYGEAILQRFRNPHIRHKLAQIAWDGSQKLSVRLLGTMADALAAGRPIERLAVPVAAWMHFVRLRAAVGVALTDPLAEQLSAIGRACSGDADADVPRFLALTSVFPRSLAQAPAFSEAVTRAYARIAKQGIQAALLA